MNGHRVRIAQRGWNGSQPAEHVDDVQVGVRMPWVELDGHRYDGLVSARVEFGPDDATLPELTVQVIGPVQIVYVDADGNPLPGQQLEQLVDDECFGADTARPRGYAPMPSELELASWREVGQIVACHPCEQRRRLRASMAHEHDDCLRAFPTSPGRWCAPCRALALLQP